MAGWSRWKNKTRERVDGGGCGLELGGAQGGKDRKKGLETTPRFVLWVFFFFFPPLNAAQPDPLADRRSAECSKRNLQPLGSAAARAGKREREGGRRRRKGEGGIKAH